MELGRGALLLLSFLVYTSVLSLMTGIISGLRLVRMSFWYHHGCKLVGDHASKSLLLLHNVSDFMFADDAASYAEDFEAVASSSIAVAKGWGLTVSLAKSKGIYDGRDWGEFCCVIATHY